MADWYRQKSWSKDIEDYFLQKLNRARKDSRAQYLKIQAIELIETNDHDLLNVAETLLHKLFIDYPDDRFNRSCSLNSLGDIYRFREDCNEAINYYKQAVDFETIYPQVRTQAYLNFAELAIKTRKAELYDTAESLIQNRIDQLLFPIEKYKTYSILSVINAHKNNFKQAQYYANLAEQNANETTSGLRYHEYLGIVNERNIWLDKLLRRK